jgi:cyclase
MLTKRIIPCLDVKDGRTVKGMNFLNLRDAGDPIELATRYSDEGADELVFLDIGATIEGRSTFLDIVRRIAQAIQIPFTVGGGMASLDDIRRALDAGADKISLNSAILKNPELLDEAASCVGSQSIVAAIDAKRHSGKWIVWSKAGTVQTNLDAIAWAQKAQAHGAGELLVTSMDRDGTQAGYDLELLKAISSSVSIPLIASGGAGTLEHLAEAFNQGHADAVLAAGIFHFGTFSISQAKDFLHNNNIAVRR